MIRSESESESEISSHRSDHGPDSRTSDEASSALASSLGYTKSYQLLVQSGLSSKDAEDLARAASPERIEKLLAYIERRRSSIDNPVGYIVKTLSAEARAQEVRHGQRR